MQQLNELQFQSTLPHGSDKIFIAFISDLYYFNPRSLTGATFIDKSLTYKSIFQSTLPHGSDRALVIVLTVRQGISIHAPSRERLIIIGAGEGHFDFNPRSLTGATTMILIGVCWMYISIHAPSRERLEQGCAPTQQR